MKRTFKAALTGLAALGLVGTAQAAEEIIFGISATPGSLQTVLRSKRGAERLLQRASSVPQTTVRWRRRPSLPLRTSLDERGSGPRCGSERERHVDPS